MSLLAGLLAACATAPGSDAVDAGVMTDSRQVSYLCTGGRILQVAFEGAQATLDAGDGLMRLDLQSTASGVHYTGGGHTLRGKGPQLDWMLPSGMKLSCTDREWARRQPQIEEPVFKLAGTAWRLVHFQSSDDAIGALVPPRVERYGLRFLEDGTLLLSLDCNRGRGRWNAEGRAPSGPLTMMAGPMTRAACGPAALDTRIAMDLVRVRSYTFRSGQLSLALEADAGLYVWEPDPEPLP